MKFNKYKSINVDEGIALRPVNNFNRDLNKGEWEQFEAFADMNTFLCEGAEIGKTYERDEVEVVWQHVGFGGKYIDVIGNTTPEDWELENQYFRQIFRLISKMETTKPVEKNPEIAYMERVNSALRATCGHLLEKKPETVISSRQFIEQVYGTSTFARSIECKDAESLMDMMDDFLDWAMQKKQEASR